MAFIVIEGLDGSGKSTQINLLRDYLTQRNTKYKFIHFPRTGHGVFGELISMFLRGELGSIGNVNPYLVSLIYAADRQDAKEEMLEWLSGDRLLLADRYVMSNVAYQCAKVGSDEHKRILKEWIYRLEFDTYCIPKPDINIFLDVPFEFITGNLTGRRYGEERKYLKGQTDIHEADLDFQKKVRQVYLDEAKNETNYFIIDCRNRSHSGILSPNEIFSKITDLIFQNGLLIE
jgi:dTMP kinase